MYKFWKCCRISQCISLFSLFYRRTCTRYPSTEMNTMKLSKKINRNYCQENEDTWPSPRVAVCNWVRICENKTVSCVFVAFTQFSSFHDVPPWLFVFLVYDQIIGMVDTTNLHIFGITCSLAWQLPHKTAFAETHTEATMHNSKISISNIERKKFDYNETQPSAGNTYHFDTYYNRSNYHSHKINDNFYDYLKKAKYDDWQKFRTNKIKWNYSHDVYPALRMRRHIVNHDEKINGSIVHPEIKQHLHHHRNTRFSLYKSIEKYLNACVTSYYCQ